MIGRLRRLLRLPLARPPGQRKPLVLAPAVSTGLVSLAAVVPAESNRTLYNVTGSFRYVIPTRSRP